MVRKYPSNKCWAEAMSATKCIAEAGPQAAGVTPPQVIYKSGLFVGSGKVQSTGDTQPECKERSSNKVEGTQMRSSCPPVLL